MWFFLPALAWLPAPPLPDPQCWNWVVFTFGIPSSTSSRWAGRKESGTCPAEVICCVSQKTTWLGRWSNLKSGHADSSQKFPF